jgi:hypothetical protein
MTTPRAAIDYCPFCCATHVIGQHPRDGESEQQYWARVNIGPRSKYGTMKHPTRSRTPQLDRDDMADAAELTRTAGKSC